MAKLTLSKPTSGYNLSAINDNFTKIEAEFQDKVLYRTNPVGENNVLQNNIDVNSFDLINISNLKINGDLTISGVNFATVVAETKVNADNAAASEAGAEAGAISATASAANAAASAASAAASYDSFDDRYLGAKALAPTLDNDGAPLLVGALYFNSSSNTMFNWTGVAWADVAATTAGGVSNVPAGSITATTVQGAIDEIVSDLAASSGASLVGYMPAGVGATPRTVQDELRQAVSADNYSTLLQAINATPIGGVLQLGAGPYVANFAISRSDITIRGAGMPWYNVGKTALAGGTIIQGKLQILGDRIAIESLGIDCGSAVCTAINAGAAMDALVLTDVTRATHYNCTVRDVIALCKDAVSAAHNFLLEGLSDSRFENLHARYGQWGVVMKTINSTADGLYAYACSQAGFTFKSDTGVAGAPALRSSVSNVKVFADDYAAAQNGILIYAASSSIADFALDNFHVTGCISSLKLVCDTRAVNVNLLFGVAVTNGTIRGSTSYGIETFGAISDVVLSNITIAGVVSNNSIKVQSDCLGIELNNIVASCPVLSATNIDLAGRFSINNVRSCVNGDYSSPAGINLVPDSAANFKIGNYIGAIGFSGVQTWTPAFSGLTVVNGTGGVTVTGSYVIIGKLLKFRVQIACSGTATSASAASATFINNLPFTVLQNDTLQCINGVVGNGGVGLVAAGGTNAYTSAWGAYNGTVTVAGQYFFQP